LEVGGWRLKYMVVSGTSTTSKKHRFVIRKKISISDCLGRRALAMTFTLKAQSPLYNGLLLMVKRIIIPQLRVSLGQKRCRQEVNTAFSENSIAADPAIRIFKKAERGGKRFSGLDFFVSFCFKTKRKNNLPG
jgi:hypothetical protein